MNIPYNVSKGRRPKSFVAKVGFLAADFLDSSPNVSESLDLINIKIECEILSPHPPEQQIMRFSDLGFCLPYLL